MCCSRTNPPSPSVTPPQVGLSLSAELTSDNCESAQTWTLLKKKNTKTSLDFGQKHQTISEKILLQVKKLKLATRCDLKGKLTGGYAGFKVKANVSLPSF